MNGGLSKQNNDREQHSTLLSFSIQQMKLEHLSFVFPNVLSDRTVIFYSNNPDNCENIAEKKSLIYLLYSLQKKGIQW